MTLRYHNETANQFVQDMEAAGLEPYHYSGRFFWKGPAVDTDSRDDVARATKVKLQQDSMGLGLVVYPVESAGNPINEEADE